MMMMRVYIQFKLPKLKDRKGLRPGRLAPSLCFSLSSIIMSSIIMAKPHHQSQVSAAKSLFYQPPSGVVLALNEAATGDRSTDPPMICVKLPSPVSASRCPPARCSSA
jgi:hypothetical protein